MASRVHLLLALAGLLSLGRGVLAHSVPNGHVGRPWVAELVERGASDASGLQKRVPSGGACGPPSNAVCDSGLCCSSAGTCGTGGDFCSGPGCQLGFGPACDGNQPATGKDTSAIPRPKFGSVPYGANIAHCAVLGKVALTFDDGPYIYTKDMLDLLKRNNVHATFFLVGNNGGKGQINNPAAGYVPIVQRMIADGHQIGSHSWSHQDLQAATPAQRRSQIINNEIALADILGVLPTYFRPPYTNCDAACLSDLGALGYHVTNYDIDTRDWQNGGVTAESTYQTILSQHSPASSSWISLAHDIQNFTVYTFAQYMIDQARQLKYDLVTLGECLGDPSVNWYRDLATGGPRAAIVPPPSSGGSVSSPSPSAGSSTRGSSSASAAQPAQTGSVKVINNPTPTPTAVPGANFGWNSTGALSTTTIAGGVPAASTVPGNEAAPRRGSIMGLIVGALAAWFLL